jgi:hypothetical protein
MIGFGPAPNERCLSCGLPIEEGSYLRWFFPNNVQIVLHLGCGMKLSRQMYSNIMHHFREEREEPIEYRAH